METMTERINRFLSANSGDGFSDDSGFGFGFSFGFGSGSGSGFSDGDGFGSGSGSGFSDGDGFGSGSGSGFSFGFGSGSGSGFSDGDGSGSGSGFGDGDGFDYGDGIKQFCGEDIYMIDGVQTIIRAVRNQYARGAILNGDLTLTPCFVAKEGNTFAHGKTLREAVAALHDKLFDDMPEEKRIEAFRSEYPDKAKKIPARKLWTWHHRLTGSCEMGRNQFARDKGIDIDKDSFTPMEFCEMCKDNYGGKTIRALMAAYEEA